MKKIVDYQIEFLQEPQTVLDLIQKRREELEKKLKAKFVFISSKEIEEKRNKAYKYLLE